ncbi:DivIVA domain-containing protein [Aeromicrobium stalagmiti]|uniref:DivIVA domain-containing protein n=1 Tax=Aeromicrobium stalagmiti TaxID=2738988 RepID=UPI001569AC31|nr:DivIVA domain-containing protein [Aeromicrobium stalagmiti]NRQ50988.1 DivIVA domain-containing protein [Aeromicrobium stalagmiti]
MPLTPEDVRNKRFTPVRLREGYDMGEVDQFLDEVEAELERLTVENEELRAKVAAASTGEPTGLIPALSSSTPAQQTPPTPAVQEPVQVAPTPEPEPTPTPAPTPAPAPVAAAPEPVRATPSMGDASSAAARLLEIASSNADQLMDAAKEEADRIVGEARAKAERLTNEARGKADRLETDARIRAQKLDDETNERRTQAVATIERDRYEIQREVEHLRAYEREYRARLKNYFQSQLDQLAANESTTSPTPVQAPADAAPRRLRSLLGDDESF